jgi:hypothetical protein
MDVKEEKVIELIKEHLIPNLPPFVSKLISDVWMLESELKELIDKNGYIVVIVDKYTDFITMIDYIVEWTNILYDDNKISYDVKLKVVYYYIKMKYDMENRLLTYLKESYKKETR